MRKMILLSLQWSAFLRSWAVCNRTERKQKPRTIALEMRERLFFTQETGELDLKAKSLLVWIMSNSHCVRKLLFRAGLAL